MQFTDGKMMEKIKSRGEKYGDPDGCVVCHGGTPLTNLEDEAHRGAPAALKASQGPQRFYPNPGNLFVAQYTCGQCHDSYVQRLRKTLMSTKTEAIHRNRCIFALKKRSGKENQPAKSFSETAFQDEDGLIPAFGSAEYKNFMTTLVSNPELFTEQLFLLPVFEAGDSLMGENPQCQDCHANRKSIEMMEDEHGNGCSSCHVPYRSGGYYSGSDPTINKLQPGKLLIHRLQGSANTRVKLQAQSEETEIEYISYSGISPDNCFTCHHDVREEALNPYGTIMSHYGGLHHAETGSALLCQDCHTTIEMHGDGNIPLTSHAQMEVKCEDCHGTVAQAPWELPLGFGEASKNRKEKPRGLAHQPLDVKGARYEAKDGYLLTSRGNPFGNVVKDGENVILHSASGKTVAVPILKSIRQKKSWKSEFSRQAMFEVKAHQEKMDCISCHSDRAQPCFGCHVSDKTKTEWSLK